MPRSPDIDVIPMMTARRGLIAATAGFGTGAAAGFVGVGGGEFRIPVLVQLLGFPLKLAGGVNLVIGLFTVVLGVWRRCGQHAWTRDDIVLTGVMGSLSVVGAGIGVIARAKLPFRPLKWVFCAYLIVVGLWMLYEAIAHVEHVLMEPTGVGRWLLAALVAFAIAVASGVHRDVIKGLLGGILLLATVRLTVTPER